MRVYKKAKTSTKNKTVLTAILFSLSLPLSAASQSIESSVRENLPNVKSVTVKETPIQGVLQVTLDEKKIYYMNSDGRYVIDGAILDTKEKKNLTQDAYADIASKKINGIQWDKIIDVTYPAKGEKKASLVVFTDVQCPFCKKMHKEIPALNSNGVEVSYVFYPRTDAKRALVDYAFMKCKDVKAMTDAVMLGDKPNLDECNSMSDEQLEYKLSQGRSAANDLGLKGTPFSVFIEKQKIAEGALSAEKLLEIIAK